MTSGPPRSREVAALIDRYDAAWNAQDLDAIASMHDDAIVFQNHTAGEHVTGAAAVRDHIGAIFARWSTLHFERRSLRCGDDFAVSEWTARAVHPDEAAVRADRKNDYRSSSMALALRAASLPVPSVSMP